MTNERMGDGTLLAVRSHRPGRRAAAGLGPQPPSYDYGAGHVFAGVEGLFVRAKAVSPRCSATALQDDSGCSRVGAGRAGGGSRCCGLQSRAPGGGFLATEPNVCLAAQMKNGWRQGLPPLRGRLACASAAARATKSSKNNFTRRLTYLPS